VGVSGRLSLWAAWSINMLSKTNSRSTRVTRGEPRPVHITLIANCRVYNSVVVLNSRFQLLLGSPQATKPDRRLRLNRRSFSLAGPGPGRCRPVVRFSRPTEKHRSWGLH
jgi:hypothetical protein